MPPLTPQALRAEVDARSAHVLRVAADSPLGGGPQWNALLAEYRVEPLPANERQTYLATGMPMARGALPIEVRHVLDHLRRQALRALTHLSTAGIEVDDELERYVREVADRGMREYITTVRPPVAASGIFANALASTPRFAPAAAGVQTMRCTACGASRSDEADQVCRFCGAPVYRDEEIP